MTSQLRRYVASKISAILSVQQKPINSDELAAAIQLQSKKGCLPDLYLPLSEVNRICGSVDVKQLTSNLQHGPIKSAQIANKDASNLILEIERQFLTKEIISSICSNFSALWQNNVNFHNLDKDDVIVEFSSPNIAKPFHTGHLRSTILGNFVANVHQAVGHNVIRINYLGDWGSQFGVLSKGYKLYGNNTLLKENAIQHLFEVYVKANKCLKNDDTFERETREEFKHLENGDEPVTSLWRKFRELSITELKQMYERLNIKFDYYEGESYYSKQAIDLCSKLKLSGLLKSKNDGTEIIEHDHPGGSREAKMRKSDGTTLYLTRDVAAAITRKEKYNFDKMFYVVENGQSDHFIALFGVLKCMGLDWYRNIKHVKFGRIHGMSTREGNVVFLRDILEEAKSRTAAAMEKSQNTKVELDDVIVADNLGISSIMINDMRSRRQNDFRFDWERVIQMKGDSGITLQYAHARLCSLEDNCGVSLQEDCDFSLLYETEAIHLISTLSKYDHVCRLAYLELEPCHIVNYLFHLRHAINGAFKTLKVKNEVTGIANARLMLFVAARHVLADGMQILGLIPLKKM